MANTKKLDGFQQLESYLFSVLKFSRKDEGINTILSLLAESNINSTGLLAVKSLVEVVLTEKMNKLKADVRLALDKS
jgi:hypothetical protein